jgi:hypothetical protein
MFYLNSIHGLATSTKKIMGQRRRNGSRMERSGPQKIVVVVERRGRTEKWARPNERGMTRHVS